MTRARYAPARTAARAGALLALLSCGAPVRDPGRDDRTATGIVALTVNVVEGPASSFEAPLGFSNTGIPFTLHVTARGSDGSPVASFNDFVSVSIAPGTIVRIEGVNGSEVVGRSVRLTAGEADVRVTLARAYGETRVWAEDDGYVPASPDSARPACADGADNESPGDGRVDYPADFGCAAANDESETGGSYALAASEPIFFATPRLFDVQGGSATTPLLNERITVTRGELIVTRVSIAGFWVTDVADRSCADPMAPMDPTRNQPCFNSIFAFNFRLPEGMRVCDRLREVQGSVQEFVSTTQFSQPAWQIEPNGLFTSAPGVRCPVPDPVELLPAMLANTDVSFEPHESSLVIARGVRLAHNVGPARVDCSTGTCNFDVGRSNCDVNNDGSINFVGAEDPNSEGFCANACQRSIGCSEWTNWRRFGQLAIDFADGQMAGIPRLIIAPKEAISDFDPMRQPVDATTAVAVTGTLKQVGPNWIIEPRCAQDLSLTNTPRPAQESCVFPRTVSEEP